ncbi:hypothetical protein R50345_08740 [Paenibacillus sp. FSL R5-0345]|uniref:RNA-binding domain-containing protein n=1 Tax=Paenibacillus sp. FSL R5-0345 TaxID=1536770 RepID=UPI0004F5D801|nr:RNA-binding domain-containing protein [Paenibacillus sp. FSL R5-0345]AIQ34690.1 hypothetical protein R50345_08740 [Paenibacillus sp. FSL R5-0345]
MDISTLSEAEAIEIINEEESHFMDFKSKRITGKDLQKIVCAFANADGGEVFVGIEDDGDTLDRWIGFNNQEESNQLIQTISIDIKPSIPVIFEYYRISGAPEKGLVLKINVAKSAEIHYTSDTKVFVRKGAQKLPLDAEKITNLKLSKGLLSFEDQIILGYTGEELSESEALLSFLESYSPITSSHDFLKKQRLIRKHEENFSPTVAGTLLYADNPSAILPKKCAVKIVRYDTSEIEPRREHLKEQFTVEGHLMSQITESLSIIQKVIENVRILGDKGLENTKYPTEAIKEIVVNALIHRDYNISDDVQILIFNNRIEVKNPGRLPGHITIDNILEERFARNSNIVRMLNKYPDPPNKDIGEGLNTAFQKMREMRLRNPRISLEENKVIVILPHDPLASPEETILQYLKDHQEINNGTARKLCGIPSPDNMKQVFARLRDRDLIELVPGKFGKASSWRKKR